jgi:hypothetical protein
MLSYATYAARMGGDPVESRGPDPHFLLVWGSTCTWTPTSFYSKVHFLSQNAR